MSGDAQMTACEAAFAVYVTVTIAPQVGEAAKVKVRPLGAMPADADGVPDSEQTVEQLCVPLNVNWVLGDVPSAQTKKVTPASVVQPVFVPVKPVKTPVKTNVMPTFKSCVTTVVTVSVVDAETAKMPVGAPTLHT